MITQTWQILEMDGNFMKVLFTNIELGKFEGGKMHGEGTLVLSN